MQRRARQIRDRRLQRVEAIVERQERMPPKGYDDRLVLDRQHRRLCVFGPGRQIGEGLALPPFGDGLLIDPVTPGEHSQARLTILYCSTDRLRRCGAAVAKWRKRETVADQPTGPKDTKSTVLSIENEAIIVAFRQHTLLPLDDCLYALQPMIPHLTRSSLHRCLQRHGISRLPEVEGAKPQKNKFKVDPIG